MSVNGHIKRVPGYTTSKEDYPHTRLHCHKKDLSKNVLELLVVMFCLQSLSNTAINYHMKALSDNTTRVGCSETGQLDIISAYQYLTYRYSRCISRQWVLKTKDPLWVTEWKWNNAFVEACYHLSFQPSIEHLASRINTQLICFIITGPHIGYFVHF